MIGSLSGTVSAISPESIILNVGGVGYELTVTSSVFDRLSGVGSQLEMSVYTDVKETAINLYGFSDSTEKNVFLMLRKVKGIGSRTAISVLSSIGADGVLKSIGSGDHDALQAIPGIGKKTAARLVVELHEQVTGLIGNIESAEGFAAAYGTRRRGSAGSETLRAGLAGAIEIEPRTAASDVILALEKLGFSRDRAKSAVESTLAAPGGERFADPAGSGDLLKQVLLNI